MKKSIAWFLAAAVLAGAAPVLSAQNADKTPPPRASERGKEMGKPEEMHGNKDKYDVNKDGKLDEQERAAMQADMKKKADEAKAKGKEATKAKVSKKMLEKYDANKNGVLDPEEEAAMKAAQAKGEKAKEQAKAKGKEKAAEKGKGKEMP